MKMPITLREILELDTVRRGMPRVVAGADRLDTPVRWVHAIELADGVARLLRGGELVLSTGIALPEAPAGLASYMAELSAAGVAGLAIELGRRYVSSLPAELADAASSRGLVLIEFRQEVAFVEITEAVHTLIFEARKHLPEQRLRGLLYQLRDEPRLRAFTGRELGPLLAYDAAHGTSLVGDLGAYLEAGGNKALAASRAHLARPTFYQRLRLIESVLGVSLDSPESRTSLHVALLALRPDRLSCYGDTGYPPTMTPAQRRTTAAIEAELGRGIRYDDESIVHDTWIRQRYEGGFAASYAPARSAAVCTAWHEAGHAVAALAVGARFSSASIRAGGSSSGRVHSIRGGGELSFVIDAAGQVAERLRGWTLPESDEELRRWLAGWRADGGDARRFRAGLRDRFGADEAAAWRYSVQLLTPLRLRIRHLARALLVHPRHLPYEVAAAIADLPDKSRH
jgi:hypothetical protein